MPSASTPSSFVTRMSGRSVIYARHARQKVDRAPDRDALVARRGDWIRTSDPLTPSQVRYQAALRPATLLRIFLPDSPRKRYPVDMHNPPHPGGIVRRLCIRPLGLTVAEAAKGLGVTRQALSDLVNEKAAVSVDMACRLSKAFGSSPETWLRMQMAYDLWRARERARRMKVRKFHAEQV